MYGRQVTKKDLATLVQQMDSNIDFESAVALVDKLLAQHPDGDTQAVRKILEFEMMEALMESEVRDEQDLIVESLVNLMRLDNADPDKILGDFPDEIQQAVRSRMQFEDEFAAEILPFDKRDQKWYLVVSYDADITEDQHQEILSIVDDLNSTGHQLYLKYSPSELKILSPSKIHDARTGGHYPNSVFPNYESKWPHLTNPFKRLGFRSDYEHPMSNMPYGHPMQEEYETYVEEWDGYDDELLSFEEWLKQEEEYDRQLQEYGDSDEYAEAMEKALQEDYEMQQELGADNYAGDYMVQSDVARIMDSAARLTMMTPPDETYSEWWKSQLSVVADKIDGLADYLEDRYADETDGMDAETFEASRGNRGHQMMTKKLASQIPKLYSQEEVSDPTVVAHYFTPYGRGDWFVIEWDGQDLMYGLADLGYPELGYFSLNELESAYRGGLPLVERDLYWTPVPLSEVQKTRMASEEGTAPIQRPMDFGEPVNWTPHDGTPSLRKRQRAEESLANEPVPAADYEFYYRSLLE